MSELLDKIKKIQERTKQQDFERRKEFSERTSTRLSENFTFFQKIFNKIFGLAAILLNFVILVVEKVFAPIFQRIFNSTKNLWNKFVYKNDEFGNARLIPHRALVFGIAVCLQWFIILLAVDLTYYTSLYLLTSHKDEVVYMTNSQEVNPQADTYSAQGCESIPCNEDTSVYFRIDPILFNHLYTLFHTGSIFYPDYVAASIPPTITKCTITSYGVRIKTLMRGFDVYPYLLKASCSPVLENNFKE